MSETRSSTPAPRRRGCCLLLDENISSVTIADPLRKLDNWKVCLHSDHLEAGAVDPEVVTYCGEQGWGLITCDDMRHSRETVAAILKYRVGVFRVVVGKKMHGVRIMSALVQAQPTIIGLFQRNRSAFWAHVLGNGRTQIVSRFDDDLKGLSPSQQRTFRRYGRI